VTGSIRLLWNFYPESAIGATLSAAASRLDAHKNSKRRFTRRRFLIFLHATR
jgi:hypothetical protein